MNDIRDFSALLLPAVLCTSALLGCSGPSRTFSSASGGAATEPGETSGNAGSVNAASGAANGGTRGDEGPENAVAVFGDDVVFDLGPARAFAERSAGLPDDVTLWPRRVGIQEVSQTGDTFTVTESGEGTLHYLETKFADAAPGRLRVTAEFSAHEPGRDASLYVLGNTRGGRYYNLDHGEMRTAWGQPPGSAMEELADGWFRCSLDVDLVNENDLLRVYLSEANTIEYQGASNAAIKVRGVAVTQRRHAAYADQSTHGHNASQADSLNQPLSGPEARGDNALAAFDGTNDYMVLAEGKGWPQHLSHSVFVLQNVLATSAESQFVFEAGESGLILANSYSEHGGRPSWYDGTWQDSAGSPVVGWQILEWHLDADAESGEIVRSDAEGSAVVGRAAYSGVALGGPASLMGNAAGNAGFAQVHFGEMVWVSRAAGHPEGVTTAQEREWVRRWLRHVADNHDWEL